MTDRESQAQFEKRTLTTKDNPLIAQPATPSRGQLLLEWTAPARPFRRRSREYYSTGASFIFLIVVILFLIQDWPVIGAVLAVTFVAYVLSTVPPDGVTHRITTFGIESIGHRYSWLELFEFWFEEKHGGQILTIQTRLPFPGRLHILLSNVDKEKVKEILQEYLPYRSEPRRTFVDRAAEWLSKKIPLEAAT